MTKTKGRKTKRPIRLIVNLSAEMAELICELSLLLGQSRSKVASSFLDELQPALFAQLEYLRKAVSLIQSGEKIRTESKQNLLSELEAHKEKLQAQVDSSLSNVLESIEKA